MPGSLRLPAPGPDQLELQPGSMPSQTPRTLAAMWCMDAATPRAAAQARAARPVPVSSLQPHPCKAGFFTRSACVTPEPHLDAASLPASSPSTMGKTAGEGRLRLSQPAAGLQSTTRSREAGDLLPPAQPPLGAQAFRPSNVRLPSLCNTVAFAAEPAPLPGPQRQRRRQQRSSSSSLLQPTSPSLLSMHQPARKGRAAADRGTPGHLSRSFEQSLAGTAAVAAFSPVQQRMAHRLYSQQEPASSGAQPCRGAGAPSRLLDVQWQASRKQAIMTVLQSEDALQAKFVQQDEDLQVRLCTAACAGRQLMTMY